MGTREERPGVSERVAFERACLLRSTIEYFEPPRSVEAVHPPRRAVESKV